MEQRWGEEEASSNVIKTAFSSGNLESMESLEH